MRTVSNVQAWIRERGQLDDRSRSIGFVPTMGALHRGHASLVERSRRENDIVVVSIFVNPAQFDNPHDLAAYPQTVERDLELLQQHRVDYAFVPQAPDLYPDGYRYRVSENEFSRRLCGAHRPGHFDGVLTVVLKLFQLVKPKRAYFGEKDYQQLLLIKGMVEALFLPIEIIACPTIRDVDGLALSSRNVRLSAEDRRRAARFPELLRAAFSCDEIAARLRDEGFRVDYIEDDYGRRFGAVHLGQVRLIDNVPK